MNQRPRTTRWRSLKKRCGRLIIVATKSSPHFRTNIQIRILDPTPIPKRVQLNVRVTLSAGKGAFGVIPEWVQGVAAGQMDESWINKHGQLDSKGGPWQNAFPKSRSLPGAKQV